MEITTVLMNATASPREELAAVESRNRRFRIMDWVMVALNDNKFHHPGAHGINSGTTALRRGLQGTGVGRAIRSWELGIGMPWRRCAAKCGNPLRSVLVSIDNAENLNIG